MSDGYEEDDEVSDEENEDELEEEVNEDDEGSTEETTEEKNLNKEYASMESLPDRQGDEPVREDKVEGIDLDEIYPEMRKKEIEDEEKANQGDSLNDEYKSMKDLPDKKDL